MVRDARVNSAQQYISLHQSKPKHEKGIFMTKLTRINQIQVSLQNMCFGRNFLYRKRKKLYARLLTFFFLGCFFLLIFPQAVLSGADDAYLRLPIPEDFVPAQHADGSPRYVTAQNIEKMLKKHSREFIKLFWNKEITHYILPRHNWLRSAMVTYGGTLTRANAQGKSQVWDCENYSQLLNALVTVRIWKAGYYDTRAALGWMKVDAKYPWAGLPGVLHALVFTVTESGFYVMEPQNGQITHLEDYPNKQFIQEAYLF